MGIRYYGGWIVGRNSGPNVPVTGQWSAGKFGVWMSANTEEQIISMINLRAQDTRFCVR